MRIGVRSAVGLGVAVLFAAPAEALSITNRDDRIHRITIVEGESRTDHSLAPAATLADVCAEGCVIRLNDSDDDEYELEGPEIVSIEEGHLFYDGTDGSPEPPSAGDGVPGSSPRP